MTYQILMIEDDEQICEVVKDYFTRESENEIVVRTAQNGQDGLDLFETERVDLCIVRHHASGNGWLCDLPGDAQDEHGSDPVFNSQKFRTGYPAWL